MVWPTLRSRTAKEQNSCFNALTLLDANKDWIHIHKDQAFKARIRTRTTMTWLSRTRT